jgi:hypothetical protein
VGTATGAGAGDAAYSGDLTPVRGGTTYTAYAYVPLASSLTNTSWDGDAKNTGTYTLTPANFGYPATAKAVVVRLAARWASANDGYAFYARNATAGPTANCKALVANFYDEAVGTVSCNASGEFVVIVAGANASNVVVEVVGYFI